MTFYAIPCCLVVGALDNKGQGCTRKCVCVYVVCIVYVRIASVWVCMLCVCVCVYV